jgi:zinc protease
MRDAQVQPAVPITPESVMRRTVGAGAVALIRETRANPSVSVRGYIPAGARYDPLGRDGLALFTGSMLTRGTDSHTSQSLALELDSMGASLGIGADIEGATFSIRCLSEDIWHLFDLLADVLLRPTFPADEVEKQRVKIVTAIQESHHDTRATAERAFRDAAYPQAHPHHRMPEGEEDTIESVTRDDLVAFHRDQYRPSGTAVAVVGDVDASRVLDYLDAAFGPWTAGVPAAVETVPSVGPASEVRRRTIPMPGKSQADIVLGVPGFNRTSPEFYAGTMANLILGRLGLMGRLGATLRDTDGLAYYVYSQTEAGFLGGPWVVRAGVNPKNLDRAIAGILREIEGLKATPVRNGELADTREFLIGSLAVRLESDAGIAQALLEIELFDLGLDYLVRYPGLVQSVTPDEIGAVARRYFPADGYTVATAVPA